MSKAAKKRNCPAVGRAISSVECGENRQSRYQCPIECPHNPFAPALYSQLIELEHTLDKKCILHLMEHAPDRAAVEEALRQACSNRSLHALHAFFAWNLFFATGADLLSCCARWETSGFDGLKNDERSLLRAKMRMRIALLEVHRVLDDERLEAADLLSPGLPRLLFQDRSMAATSVRFSTLLAWIYPLPHFWRLSGTAIVIPEIGQFEPLEVVAEIVRHLRGPGDVEQQRRWLAEHFVSFEETLSATSRLRRREMVTGLNTRFGKAVYELRTPFATCRAQFDDRPDVDHDDLADAEREEGFAEARVWFTNDAPMKASVPEGGRAVLGRVLLGQTHWRIEGFGESYPELRRRFESHLGSQVKFAGERLDDLGARLAAKEPEADESLVPPRLAEGQGKLVFTSSMVHPSRPGLSKEDTEVEWMRAADRAFLDDHVPALDHKTPREAAQDPALRPRLLRLLKQRVRAHDERNLRTGRTDDINWLLREVGASEIEFEPPPWRPPPPEDSVEDDQQLDADEAPDVDLPPPPRLPIEPLQFEEAARRLDAAMSEFESGDEAIVALVESGSTLIVDARDITADMLTDDEFAFCVSFFLQAWFTLVPPGHRAPMVRFENLESSFHLNFDEVVNATESGSLDRIIDFSKTCRQPVLMQLLATELLSSGLEAPKKRRPSVIALSAMLALLKSVVDEVDMALRERPT